MGRAGLGDVRPGRAAHHGRRPGEGHDPQLPRDARRPGGQRRAFARCCSSTRSGIAGAGIALYAGSYVVILAVPARAHARGCSTCRSKDHARLASSTVLSLAAWTVAGVLLLPTRPASSGFALRSARARRRAARPRRSELLRLRARAARAGIELSSDGEWEASRAREARRQPSSEQQGEPMHRMSRICSARRLRGPRRGGARLGGLRIGHRQVQARRLGRAARRAARHVHSRAARSSASARASCASQRPGGRSPPPEPQLARCSTPRSTRSCASRATPNDPRFAELYGLNNTGQTGGTRRRRHRRARGLGRGRASARSRPPAASRSASSTPASARRTRTSRQGRRLRAVAGPRPILGGSIQEGTCADDNGHGTHVAGTITAQHEQRQGRRGRRVQLAARDLQGARRTARPGLDLRCRQLHRLGCTTRARR